MARRLAILLEPGVAIGEFVIELDGDTQECTYDKTVGVLDCVETETASSL